MHYRSIATLILLVFLITVAVPAMAQSEVCQSQAEKSLESIDELNRDSSKFGLTTVRHQFGAESENARYRITAQYRDEKWSVLVGLNSRCGVDEVYREYISEVSQTVGQKSVVTALSKKSLQYGFRVELLQTGELDLSVVNLQAIDHHGKLDIPATVRHRSRLNPEGRPLTHQVAIDGSTMTVTIKPLS